MSIKKLTVAQAIKAYVADPSRCPYCGGTDLQGDGVDIIQNGKGAQQECNCQGCGASFNALFTISGAELFSEPEGKKS